MKKTYPPAGFPAALFPFWTPTSVVRRCLPTSSWRESWIVADHEACPGWAYVVLGPANCAFMTECLCKDWGGEIVPNREIEVPE